MAEAMASGFHVGCIINLMTWLKLLDEVKLIVPQPLAHVFTNLHLSFEVFVGGLLLLFFSFLE